VGRIKLHLIDRNDFIKYQDPSAGAQGLFVPGSATPGVGEPVTVEVIFQGGPRVLLQGQVCWRRALGDARTRAGVGVAVDPGEAAKMSYLLGYVRGGLLDVRLKRRLPVRLRVAYSSPRGRRVNFTRDLNEGGVFVRASELLDLGAPTRLLISPPGRDYRPIELRGTVARQQLEGSDRGMGLRFDFASDEERELVRGFVQKLESDYLDGRLPDDVLL
jgi:uncharacterized protein (TIGR02266 family)